MQVRATNMTAAVTGLYSGLLGLVLGPRVDAGGPWWLLIATAAFGGPAYFFVFGVRREEMVGLWVLKPALLKRMALCFAGIICVATIAQVVSSLWGKGAV
jgi:hypothetical protein